MVLAVWALSVGDEGTTESSLLAGMATLKESRHIVEPEAKFDESVDSSHNLHSLDSVNQDSNITEQSSRDFKRNHDIRQDCR